MTWDYIAGFFDGEGCLKQYGRTGISITVMLYQGSRNGGKPLLEEIKAFLNSKGISCSVKINQKMKNGNIMYVLFIHGVRNVRPFLTNLYPSLRVKRIVAQDILRLWVMFPRDGSGQIKKLVCKNGHNRTKDNISNGGCRLCRNIYQQRQYWKKKAV